MGLLQIIRQSRWLLVPLALAMLARLLVAPGWMVDRASSGELVVRICSDGSGSIQNVAIRFDRDPLPSANQPEKCPFAVVGDAPPPMLAMDFPPGLRWVLLANGPALTRDRVVGAAASWPPGTGPPAFA